VGGEEETCYHATHSEIETLCHSIGELGPTAQLGENGGTLEMLRICCKRFWAVASDQLSPTLAHHMR